MVKCYRLFVVCHELLVKDVECFKERGIRIGLNGISLELAFFLRSGLTPNLKLNSYICHLSLLSKNLRIMTYSYGFEP